MKNIILNQCKFTLGGMGSPSSQNPMFDILPLAYLYPKYAAFPQIAMRDLQDAEDNDSKLWSRFLLKNVVRGVLLDNTQGI